MHNDRSEIVEDGTGMGSLNSPVSRGADDSFDAEERHPAGHLGQIVEGHVDLRLEELRPGVRDRSVTILVPDERLGTKVPTVLIEALDFFDRTDAFEIAAELADATGLERVDVAFVPPRFLTRTSSGEFDRRQCLTHFTGMREAQQRAVAAYPDLTDESRASPSGVARDRPAATPGEQGIRIVSLADGATMRRLDGAQIERRLGQAFGCKVFLEHLCLPPSPVLLSDIVFHDFFQPRLDQAAYTAIDRTMAKLKQASLILVDDVAEMNFLYESTYPALSHDFSRDPRADLISFRGSDYFDGHDLLPLGVVSGLDIPLSTSTAVLGQMRRLLKIPIFRIATVRGFAEFTRDWDFHDFDDSGQGGVDPGALTRALSGWANAAETPLARRRILAGEPVRRAEPARFCCHTIKQTAIDRIVQHYDRFCIAGNPSSVPYLRRALDRAGKPYVHVPSHALQTLDKPEAEFDCLVICGLMREVPPEIGTPVIALQQIGLDGRTRHVGAFADEIGPLQDQVVSGTDWFHPFSLERLKDLSAWRAARAERLLQRKQNPRVPTVAGRPMVGASAPIIPAPEPSTIGNAAVDPAADPFDDTEGTALRRSMRHALDELKDVLRRMSLQKAKEF